jgi:ribose 5-phosphate isomerase B
MVIYIGADHRGFKLKEFLKDFLKAKGYSVADMGAQFYDENDDYPDFAQAVAKKVSLDYENAKGILICGSGVGVAVVANKFAKVRAALVASNDQAFDSRNDDDANVLCLAADYLEPEEAKGIVTVWLQTPFADEEKFRRRLNKISEIELQTLRPVVEDENSLTWK